MMMMHDELNRWYRARRWTNTNDRYCRPSMRGAHPLSSQVSIGGGRVI